MKTICLSAKPSEKKVQFSEEIKVKVVEKEPEIVSIDEEKIDRLLHLIHEADPSADKSDSEELLILEGLYIYIEIRLRRSLYQTTQSGKYR